MKKIYIAGGCFWGVEEYFSYIKGVISTKVGFANGFKPNPDFRNLCENKKGYAETCEIIYNESVVTLGELLTYMFKAIDPTSINKQGRNKGSQYRSGIYWIDPIDELTSLNFIKNQQKNYKSEIAVEIEPLTTFFLAKQEQQQYLKKNKGYCHIPQNLINELKKF